MAEEAASRGSGGFFDKYPRFFETSDTWPFPNRLNNRYKALIERNADILKGASVLDLASHDGRWSFAVLQTGARKVVGLEGQSVLTADAEKTFQEYGIGSDRYRFVCGDLFETVKEFDAGSFDVVFCFGFFHMHNRHFEMLKQVERLAPRYLVLDVWVLPFTNDPVTYLIPHAVDEQGSARYTPDFDYPIGLRMLGYCPQKTDQPVSPRDGAGIKFGNREANGALPQIMMIAYPSQSALEWLLAEAGFGDLDYYDWKNAPIENWNDLFDYQSGQRISLIARNLRYQK